MPLVTVLLPVCNGEAYLRSTMESILEQSFNDFEFLIIDDGSTDESVSIINSFKDTRIRLLRNHKRLRLSGALNRGIKETTGKYIARIDADDIALPDRLNVQVSFMENNAQIGICGSEIEVFGDNLKTRRDTYPLSSEKINAYALFDCPFCHPAVMFRKELFLGHNLFFDGSYYPTEDFELWSRAIHLFPTANINKVLLRYRIHGASMTGSDWKLMDRQATRVIDKLLTNLRINYSTEELSFHRMIGRGRSCRLKKPAELEMAEKWLKKLIHANDANHTYKKIALAETIALIWYRLCLNNTFLGLDVFKQFITSDLINMKRTPITRFTVLLGSVLKNQFVSSPMN